jgi:hypothetical protein
METKKYMIIHLESRSSKLKRQNTETVSNYMQLRVGLTLGHEGKLT